MATRHEDTVPSYDVPSHPSHLPFHPNIPDDTGLRYSLPWTVLLICAYSLLLVAGMVGNFSVVCVMAFPSRARTVMNMFIFNLAVADLLVILFCVIPTL